MIISDWELHCQLHENVQIRSDLGETELTIFQAISQLIQKYHQSTFTVDFNWQNFSNGSPLSDQPLKSI
jgi:hypothetical protein